MTTSTATPLPPLQQKIADTMASMKNYTVERHEEILIITLCFVGRLNAFFKSEPGTAKTYTVEKYIEHIDGFDPDEYFRILVGGYTTDADFFGVLDLAAMDNNERRRVLDKTLVKAKVGVGDELFKANDSALNSLLTILNEHKYDNGTDGTVESPLFSFFAMSNEFPKNEGLAALADRLHFWKIVDRIREDANVVKMLEMQGMPDPTPTITLAEIEEAQAEVDKVDIDDEVYQALTTLRRDLFSEGVEPTDRRFALTLRCIKANAWLNGQTVATVEDMTPIRHMLWNRPDQIATVDKLVLSLASEIEAEAANLNTIADEISEAVDRCLDADNERSRNSMAMEVHTNLEELSNDVFKLQKQVAASGRPSATVERLTERADALMARLMRDAFKIDPDTGAKLA